MKPNEYIAIQLGSTKFTALAAEDLDDQRIRIISSESIESANVKNGVIEQVPGTAFKVGEVLKLLQNSARISKIEKVSTNVGAKSMKHIPVSVSRFVGASKTVSAELLADMQVECKSKLQGENIYIFEIIPLYFDVDGRRAENPEGMTATQITGKYNVIYGNIKINKQLRSCFDMSKIELEYISLAAESLATAVLDEDVRVNGCALIHFGSTTTTLSIYKDDVLQNLLVVPFGGVNITKDIQELGISQSNAERLKCLKGSALESTITNPIYIQIPSDDIEKPDVKISTKFLAKIIEARLDELLMPIFEEIRKEKSKLEAGIFIAGGAAKMSQLEAYLEHKTGLEVSKGTHHEWLMDGTDPKYYDTYYSQLIGLIILAKDNRKRFPQGNNENKKNKKNKKEDNRSHKDKLEDFILKFFSDNSLVTEVKEDAQKATENPDEKKSKDEKDTKDKKDV